MNNFRYQLSNKPKKQRCPQCGRLSYKPYIDMETGEEVGDGCGRCDHQSSCTYHLPPREYFVDHPHPISSHSFTPKPKTEKHLYTLPKELPDKFHNPSSTFACWMAEQFRDKIDLAKQAYEDYRLGCTSLREVIFWQIDMEGKVRSGKIMKYNKEGHRIGTPSWVHAKLMKEGRLTNDFQLTQCLFGEHLLTKRPNDVVCLVESEKTAVIASVFFPQFVWVATGGCGGLSQEKLKVLKNRKVIVYPDSGAYQKWKEIMARTTEINYSIIEEFEAYPDNTDLADILIA